jgi:hypothetical protein
MSGRSGRLRVTIHRLVDDCLWPDRIVAPDLSLIWNVVGVKVAVQFMSENGATPSRLDAKPLSLNTNAGRDRGPTGNWPRPIAFISEPLVAIRTANGDFGGALKVISFKTCASERHRRTCEAPVSAIAVTSFVGGGTVARVDHGVERLFARR